MSSLQRTSTRTGIALSLSMLLGLCLSTSYASYSSTVSLVTAAGIANIPTSAIVGNLGLYVATGANVTGTVYFRDASSGPGVLSIAIDDKGIAYTDADSRAADYTELATGNLVGLNLGPATYAFSF